jgi:hypothetical protein
MADFNNDSQISDVPNLTEASASEVHEQFRRTEAERVRLYLLVSAYYQL